MKRLTNAPLMKTQCIFGWSDDGGDITINPIKLHEAVKSDEHFGDADYEWQIPQNLLNDIQSDVAIYKISYSHMQINYTLLLSKRQLILSCDDSYQTWREFRDEILYIENLLRLLFTENKQLELLQLRYVDAFQGEALQGKSPSEFLEQDLGVALQFPRRIQLLSETDKKTWFFDCQIDVNTNTSLSVSLGEAQISPMDMAAVCDIISERDLTHMNGKLEVALNNLHDVADNFFFTLIEPIVDRFQ